LESVRYTAKVTINYKYEVPYALSDEMKIINLNWIILRVTDN